MRRAGRLFRGGAEIRVTGAEPWKFPNRCAQDSLYLEDVRAEDPFTLRGVLRWRDLPRAKRAALRCGCILEILSARGAPLLWRRLRRRWLLTAAAVLTAAGLFALSLFLWDVRVTENDTEIPDAEILRVLERQGVRRGAFYPGFHADLIRSRALSELPELCWLAVNVRNGRANVEVRAAVPAPELWDPRKAADVTAARGGVITDLVVLEGTPLVKRGDAVLPNQVLVSADRPGGTAVHARAEITARTWRELAAVAPLVVQRSVPAGREKLRFALLLGRRRINFYADSGILPPGCVKMTKTWRPGAEGAFSPNMAWITEKLFFGQSETHAADPEELCAALETRLLDRLREEMGERGEILSTRFSVSRTGELLTVTLRAECSERIDTDTPRE